MAGSPASIESGEDGEQRCKDEGNRLSTWVQAAVTFLPPIQAESWPTAESLEERIGNPGVTTIGFIGVFGKFAERRFCTACQLDPTSSRGVQPAVRRRERSFRAFPQQSFCSGQQSPAVSF